MRLLRLKGVEQIEGDGSVGIVVPHLNEVDAHVINECGVVQIKARTLCEDLVPVARVVVQLSAGLDQRIHLRKGGQHTLVGHMGQ